MTQVYAYYVPQGSGYRAEAPTTEAGVAPSRTNFRDAAQSAVEAYALTMGWRHINYLTTPEQLADAVATLLHRDDVLLIPDLTCLSAKPSQQEAIIMGLLAKGTSIHVLSLRGPAEQYLLPLREVWRASQAVEQELAAALEREAVREEQFKQEQKTFESTFIAQMAQTFGVEKILPKLTTNGHAKSNGHGAFVPTSADIMVARNKAGLSQEAAAKMAGISRSYYQRIERGDAPPDMIAQVYNAIDGGQDNPAPASSACEDAPPHEATVTP